MKPPNPVLESKDAKPKHEPTHHPTLEWNQLPDFFDALKSNDPMVLFVVVLAVKVLLSTYLMVNSYSGLRWDEMVEKKGIWTVPALRMKNNKDHHLPLSNQILDIHQDLRALNGHKALVYFTGRRRKHPYMNSSSINAHLTKFIDGVVTNGSKVNKEKLIASYSHQFEFQRFMGYESNWKITNFMKVCTGLGFRIKPDLKATAGLRVFKYF